MTGDADTQWVVYSIHDQGGMGRFLAVEETREDAKATGDKWWDAFDSGEKERPTGYAGISWKPVADFDNWESGE
jgi:hypothetical protein